MFEVAKEPRTSCSVGTGFVYSSGGMEKVKVFSLACLSTTVVTSASFRDTAYLTEKTETHTILSVDTEKSYFKMRILNFALCL